MCRYSVQCTIFEEIYLHYRSEEEVVIFFFDGGEFCARGLLDEMEHGTWTWMGEERRRVKHTYIYTGGDGGGGAAACVAAAGVREEGGME